MYKIPDHAPCFHCQAFRNTPRDKCWDLCDRLFRWNEARISRAAQEEKVLGEMEQTVHKHVKEFKSAFEESGGQLEREEFTDKELEAMADEILEDLEKENKT